VLVRDKKLIPVTQFDGLNFPFPDKSFDVVMFVDVLHHTDNPEVLLREAMRVAANSIVLKDHTQDGVFAAGTLRLMDWVGNSRHGVRLPYNFWSRRRWDQTLVNLGLTVVDWKADLDLYPWPMSLVFDRSLHFVARLRAREPLLSTVSPQHSPVHAGCGNQT